MGAERTTAPWKHKSELTMEIVAENGSEDGSLKSSETELVQTIRCLILKYMARAPRPPFPDAEHDANRMFT